jgi:V8-like Glu-specific endopeptidase
MPEFDMPDAEHPPVSGFDTDDALAGIEDVAPDDLPRVEMVGNTDAAPYHSIIYMRTRRSRGGGISKRNYESSAALIGPRHLLTAAHNIHSTRLSRLIDVEAVLGVDSDREWALPEAFSPTEIRVARGYRWGNFDRDYAVATLRDETPFQTQFRLPLPGETLLSRAMRVHVAGFPADHGFQNRKLYRGDGQVIHIEARTFSYAVDTGRGMSGCPVWIEQKTGTEREFVVVGIHVGFAGGFAIARRTDEATLLQAVEEAT